MIFANMTRNGNGLMIRWNLLVLYMCIYTYMYKEIDVSSIWNNIPGNASTYDRKINPGHPHEFCLTRMARKINQCMYMSLGICPHIGP